MSLRTADDDGSEGSATKVALGWNDTTVGVDGCAVSLTTATGPNCTGEDETGRAVADG